MTSQNFAPTRDPQNVTSNGDVRPRQLVHRGTIQARALWFAFELMGKENARHRVLESWRSGSVVHRFADGFLLIWPDSQRVVCEASPALPLTENDGVLSSCPLSRDEWRQLLGNEKRATPLVIFVRESRAQLVSLGVATTENVASWLDVSNFALQSAQSLGEAPRAPLLLAEPIDFVARRALIGQEADAQLQRVLDSLRGEKTAAKTNGFGASLQALGARFLAAIDGVRWWQKTRVGTRKPLSLLTLCLLAALALALLRSHFWTVLAAIFLLWLLREILPAVEVPQGANPVSAGSGSASRNPARASAFADLVARFVARFAARFSFAHRAKTAQKQLGFQPKTRDNLNDAMRSALAKALALSQLSGLVGRHQARYVARMMEMFERGDWDSALRHAIPMGALSGAGNNWKAPPFLGRLFARSDLKINANWQSVGSTIGLSEEWSVRMRALYRRAFESLSERGRWEEAAFVLAELLGDNEEAVAFLELHDRKTLAAEMAEARDLPAGLVVRQWFVAGDETRAIAVARRTDSFADAVFRLEQKHDERAQWLRVLWARSLGQSGQYAAAVEALWPIESLRESTRAYREMALESGGQSAARVLARWLQLDPDALDDETLRYRVLDLLNDESRENARARLAFAQVLRGQNVALLRNRATQNAARWTARALLRDCGNGFSTVEPKAMNSLLDLARDSALRADVPALPQNAKREQLSNRNTPREISIAANDTGTTPILDAAFLSDGKCVVALGEAGALLLNRDGKIVHRFDQPAHKLVMSDNGDRAIALAPRGLVQTGVDTKGQAETGTVQRLAILDFARGTSKHWCEAVVNAHADSYDGSLWYAAVGRELCAIDALNSRFAAL